MKALAPNYKTVHAIDKADLPKVKKVDTKCGEVPADRKFRVIPRYQDERYIKEKLKKGKAQKNGYMPYSDVATWIQE
mgnify:CR=1 FL=1